MLKKSISWFGVFSIASGAMISSGIFILPGLAFAKTGPAVFLSYFIAGLLGLIGIFSVIELSTAMPMAGGDYYFINKTFGPLFGTISGFLGWSALSLKSAFAIFGIGEIIFLYTNISPFISCLILTVFFVLLNILGAKEAVFFQILLVIGLLSLMLIYIIIGLPRIDKTHFSPFLTGNFNTIIITSGFVFISFGGLLKVATISEEVKNPKKNIPLGMLSSIIMITLLYTLITFVITGTLSSSAFEKSLTPVADSAKIIMGTPGYIIIIIASFLAFFTTANAGIMSASRYPLALSRDNLFPKKIASVNKRFKTPVFSLILTGAIIFISLLLPLELLVKSASSVILTSYVLTNFAVIILRESNITTYKPSFKVPFYPYLQILSIILFSFFIIDLGAAAIELSFSFLFISFCIYIFYGRKIKNSEYALLYLLKRITDKRLTENIIENELREIIINRDNIEQDNFDKLVKEAVIIDIKKSIDFKSLLKEIANNLSKEFNITEDDIITRFLKRQEESSTAVSEFLAIPHIIIEGKNKIILTIVRSKKGIFFDEKHNKVEAAFFLGGTKDKRDLHLKTLASIASLVSQKHFKDEWRLASNFNEIKNFMILNDRKRFK